MFMEIMHQRNRFGMHSAYTGHIWGVCVWRRPMISVGVIIGHVNNIPIMQFFTGIPEILGQNHVWYQWLSVSGTSKLMHCGMGYSLTCPILVWWSSLSFLDHCHNKEKQWAWYTRLLMLWLGCFLLQDIHCWDQWGVAVYLLVIGVVLRPFARM